MPDGIDYAWGGPPSFTAMRQAGITFVCRYLSHSPSKNLTQTEATRLSDNGFWIVVVWETVANRALSGYSGGAADARDADAQARACGMPPDRPIYFAVDWDAGASQQAAIDAYLDGAASVLGRDRVGIYGGYGPVSRAMAAGKAAWGWQTYAWSGGRWHDGAHLQQYSNSHLLGGVDCDYDRATKTDFGQWRVGVSPNVQEDDVAEVVSVGDSAPEQEIPAKSDASIYWNKAYSDKHGLFQEDKDGGAYSIVILDKAAGSLWAIASAIFQIEGLQPGDTVDVSWDRMSPPAKDGDPWQVSDHAWKLPFTADKNGVIRDELGGQFGLDSSVRLRLRVYNPNAYPVKLQGGMAKVTLLKY